LATAGNLPGVAILTEGKGMQSVAHPDLVRWVPALAGCLSLVGLVR
jgi:hypothetical protein